MVRRAVAAMGDRMIDEGMAWTDVRRTRPARNVENWGVGLVPPPLHSRLAILARDFKETNDSAVFCCCKPFDV